jgi:16S rRNA (cytosine967-C5)-methyltransferase
LSSAKPTTVARLFEAAQLFSFFGNSDVLVSVFASLPAPSAPEAKRHLAHGWVSASQAPAATRPENACMNHLPHAGSSPLSFTLALAGEVVSAVKRGESATAALDRTLLAVRPAVRALSFEGLRRLGAASTVLRHLAPKLPKAPLDGLLIVAIALLWPDAAEKYDAHTVVNQAVEAARKHKGAPAGFVNAVLRAFLRARDDLVRTATSCDPGRHEHPAWWVQRVRKDWPVHWEALLAAANTAPPMTLRVNSRILSGQAYIDAASDAGIEAALLPDPRLGGQGVVLHKPIGVDQLPGFAQGHVSVQDGAAQLAAPLLLGAGLPAGARVLDACAAPGGKSAHLLELGDLDLLCLDHDATRLMKVDQTMKRLGLHAELLAADASKPSDWWDGRPFDAILLDAPCSASGIVRRHPDIRWLRRTEDVLNLARMQDALLDALWPLLRPGGRLLFATCSLFKAEGQDRIDAFLQRHARSDATLLQTSPGHILPVIENERQPLQTASHLVDAFFYALLEKP